MGAEERLFQNRRIITSYTRFIILYRQKKSYLGILELFYISELLYQIDNGEGLRSCINQFYEVLKK